MPEMAARTLRLCLPPQKTPHAVRLLQEALSNEIMLAFLDYALADDPDEKKSALLKTLESIDEAQSDVIIKSAL